MKTNLQTERSTQVVRSLIIKAECAFLQDAEGVLIQQFVTAELLAEDPILTAEQFDCTELVIQINTRRSVRGGKGTTLYAKVSGAEAYANVRGVKAFADEWGASAYADAVGAEAYANVRGAIACANVWGAKAFANARDAVAFADAVGAIAFANVRGAGAHTNVWGARAFPYSTMRSSLFWRRISSYFPKRLR